MKNVVNKALYERCITKMGFMSRSETFLLRSADMKTTVSPIKKRPQWQMWLELLPRQYNYRLDEVFLEGRKPLYS